MTAGVPGLGLSGLFVLLSALALPLARRRGRAPAPGRRQANPHPTRHPDSPPTGGTAGRAGADSAGSSPREAKD